MASWTAALPPRLLLGIAAAAGAAEAPERRHFWPNARGNVGSYGVSEVKVPRNFSDGKPSWKWTHPNGLYGTTVVGGPVIDFEKNLYFAELTGLWKFSPDGQLHWTTRPLYGAHQQPCFFPDGPGLMGDSVYVSTTCGELCSIDIATGQYNWGGSCRRYFPTTGMDSKYVTGHDGVVIIGTDDAGNGGSKHVVAVNGTDGTKLWEFKPDVPTWNNMGMFPGDDTVIFQDWDSRAYRLGLHNGTLLWKAGGMSTTRYPFAPYAETWTDGGLLLGMDNVAYAVSSAVSQEKSSRAYSGGGVHAHRVSDGHILWEAKVDHPVLTWPVSAKLEGDKSFTVFAFPSPGAHKNCMVWEIVWHSVEQHLRNEIRWVLTRACGTAAVLAAGWSWRRSASARRSLCNVITFVLLAAVLVGLCEGVRCWLAYHGVRAWHNTGSSPSDIVALDADTGAVKWKYMLYNLTRPTAVGDQEGFSQKIVSQPWRAMCCPVAYSSPSVDGDGVVYIGHMSGNIFGVKDWDKNGHISDEEVYRFDAGGAFLHSGPAFAPGVFAFTTCDQLFVWRF